MKTNLRVRYHILLGIFGLLMGFSLHRIGFSDYGELHRLFTLVDLRMLSTFAGAVVIAAIGFAWFGRGIKITPKPYHKGSIAGGLLFGSGWALSGACPSIVLVHLGEGKFIALSTCAGMLCGVWLYTKLKSRYFRWTTGVCDF